MFGKSNKDNNSSKKGIGDERVATNDLRRRIPKVDYRPCDYEILPRFKNLKVEIDEYLDKLFAGEIDAGNGNVLDELIIDVGREARAELDRQYISHQDIIIDLKAYHDGNVRQFESELAGLKTDLEGVNSRLVAISEREESIKFTGGRD